MDSHAKKFGIEAKCEVKFLHLGPQAAEKLGERDWSLAHQCVSARLQKSRCNKIKVVLLKKIIKLLNRVKITAFRKDTVPARQ